MVFSVTFSGEAGTVEEETRRKKKTEKKKHEMMNLYWRCMLQNSYRQHTISCMWGQNFHRLALTKSR